MNAKKCRGFRDVENVLYFSCFLFHANFLLGCSLCRSTFTNAWINVVGRALKRAYG
jgi:hypothetical protein